MGSEERREGLTEVGWGGGRRGHVDGGGGGNVRGGVGAAVPVKQLIVLPFFVFDLVLNFDIYNYNYIK